MENKTTENAGSPGAEPLVKRGYLFLEDSDWNKADEYFDRALDINPEYAPAYIGKLCAELMVNREDSLGDYQKIRQGKKIDKPLGEYGHFQKALRFADDDCRKKLNDYDQKIKDSFPKKIPQTFKDEFIKGEIARLENEIAACDKEIAKHEQDETYFNSKYKELCAKKLSMVTEARSQNGDYSSKMSEIERELEEYNPLFKQYAKESANTLNGALEAGKRVNEYTRKKAEYVAKKKAIESLAGISSCLDRMDVHYDRFVEAMKKESTEDEYNNFAEQFRSLEGYKDSIQLADECAKLAVKAKDKCEKLAIKTKYDSLIQEKNKTTTLDQYEQLAKKFREMGGYENSAQLADECDKQVRVLKERIEEEKRQEAESKRREAVVQKAADARYEQERKEKAAKEKRERLTRTMLTFVPFIVGMVLYYIAFKAWIQGIDGSDNPLLDSLVPLIGFGLPLVLIHLRKLFVISIIIFCIAILIHIFAFTGHTDFFYWGSIAMAVSFIMALVFPRD
jgi:hypothetical protein